MTRWSMRGIGWFLAALGFSLPAAPAQSPRAPVGSAGPEVSRIHPAAPLPRLALDGVLQEARESVRSVLEQPSLTATGPAEEFSARLPVYQWLLDHPDCAARAWRRLGAPCLEITDRAEGRFNWVDGRGSNVCWQTVYRGAGVQVWYAEGQVRPGPLFPMVPVRVVLVMHFREQMDRLGQGCITHQADVYVQTDSKTAAVLIKMLGPSIPRLSEQALGQLQMFFSGLANYFQRHPDRADGLFCW